MLKRIFYPVLILSTVLFISSCSSSNQQKNISDGIYLIQHLDTSEHHLTSLKKHQQEVFFSDMFDDYNSEEYLRVIIDTSEYVPIQLEKAPETEQQTEDKKKLMLSLTKSASEKLKSFTSKHVMERVVMVVDGEALTMHKIRVPITSGKLQITRCNDNACEKLFIALKDNEG